MRRNPKTIWLCSNSLVLYFGIADLLILRFEIVSKYFMEFKQEHLTFYIGGRNEQLLRADEYSGYRAHNIKDIDGHRIAE
jgi:hypothetical protein